MVNNFAPRDTRPREAIGYVGVPHGVELAGENFFTRTSMSTADLPPFANTSPKLIDLVLNKKINPGKMFNLALPLDQVAEATALWTNVTSSKCYCFRELVEKIKKRE